MKLQQILKDSNYKLTQFSQDMIEALENRVIEKQSKDKITYKVMCLIRQKEINLTPEEIIRQLYIQKLNVEYGYPCSRMQCEYPVQTGSSNKRADIVILDTENPPRPYIIVELKQPDINDGQKQLQSYCRWERAPLGVWTNGIDIEYFIAKTNSKSQAVRLNALSNLPHADQSLIDFLRKSFTIKQLMLNDKLERRTLKEIITQFEDVVLANSGADGFEEIFKLIFTKLFDEFQSGRDKDEITALLKNGFELEKIDDKDFRSLEFRNDDSEENAEKRELEVKKRLENLFAEARKKWHGIFPVNDSFKLTASHLSTCVSYLQDVKLFNSNLEVIDDAFEYLVNKESKGDKGQYFTARYVIDMCVKMLNPQPHETIIDTAAGSCGFPMHAIFHVWQQLDPHNTNLLTSGKRTNKQINYVQNNVFGIDFDTRSVRVGRALNLIAGDGQTNVLCLNTLDYKRWKETIKEQSWIDIYHEGFKKLRQLTQIDDNYKKFEFDILMANPPFAGEITDEGILSNYELTKNTAGKQQSKVGRDILFIERNLDFLKDGGRMAVVLPQGRFNNSSDKTIREFISKHCRILAIIGLHGNTFKPHTGTKTSVLFVQKWTDNNGICPRQEDYPIFFATMQKSAKDNSGEKIYLKQQDGSYLLDHHGHRIIDHDLFNHDGLTQDGIAEAFIEFAKKEKLSFFDCDLLGFKNLEGLYTEPFNQIKYQSLLDRLEISVLMLSELKLDNEKFRIDDEFFLKKYVMAYQKIKSISHCYFREIIEILTDYHANGSYETLRNNVSILDEKNYAYMIRSTDLEKLDFENDVKYVDERAYNYLNKTKLFGGEILINKIGNPGNVYLMPKLNKPATVGMNLFMIRLKPNTEYREKYLWAFFNSKLGQSIIYRKVNGTVPLTIDKEAIKSLPIPKVSLYFQCKIENIVDLSFQKLEESKAIYSAAENLLLEELGLKDFKPSQQNINIKSFKDSFLSSGRLDAEYYQPKYEEIEKICFENAEYTKQIKDIQLWNGRGLQPYYVENGELNVINSRHILEQEFDYKNFEKTSIENWETQAKARIYRNDILTYTTGANIGRTQVYLKDEKALASNHVNILRIENENPIYVAFVLNSKIGRLQTEQLSAGSAQQELYPKDIDNFYVPFIKKEVQTQIADLVKQSFVLKSESEKLLETAKRAVEMAIETNEQTAMDYINSNLEQGLE